MFSLSERAADNSPEKLEIYWASGPHWQKAGILYFMVNRAEAIREIFHIPILWTKVLFLLPVTVFVLIIRRPTHGLLFLLFTDWLGFCRLTLGLSFYSCGVPDLGLEDRHTNDTCSLSSSWLNSLDTCTLFILGTWITCSFLARRQGRLMGDLALWHWDPKDCKSSGTS